MRQRIEADLSVDQLNKLYDEVNSVSFIGRVAEILNSKNIVLKSQN